MKVTIFLKKGDNQDYPFKSCYFAKKEYQRLISDFDRFKKTGLPKDGIYNEDLGSNSSYSILLEFEAVSKIKY